MLPTWPMLPPATPGLSHLLLAVAFVAGVCLILGLATRISSMVALAVIAYLISMVQERDSRAASLLLQLGVLNCFMQLGRWVWMTLASHGSLSVYTLPPYSALQ